MNWSCGQKLHISKGKIRISFKAVNQGHHKTEYDTMKCFCQLIRCSILCRLTMFVLNSLGFCGQKGAPLMKKAVRTLSSTSKSFQKPAGVEDYHEEPQKTIR